MYIYIYVHSYSHSHIFVGYITINSPSNPCRIRPRTWRSHSTCAFAASGVAPCGVPSGCRNTTATSTPPQAADLTTQNGDFNWKF